MSHPIETTEPIKPTETTLLEFFESYEENNTILTKLKLSNDLVKFFANEQTDRQILYRDLSHSSIVVSKGINSFNFKILGEPQRSQKKLRLDEANEDSGSLARILTLCVLPEIGEMKSDKLLETVDSTVCSTSSDLVYSFCQKNSLGNIWNNIKEFENFVKLNETIE